MQQEASRLQDRPAKGDSACLLPDFIPEWTFSDPNRWRPPIGNSKLSISASPFVRKGLKDILLGQAKLYEALREQV